VASAGSAGALVPPSPFRILHSPPCGIAFRIFASAFSPAPKSGCLVEGCEDPSRSQANWHRQSESNRHSVTRTGFWTQRAYQFRHARDIAACRWGSPMARPCSSSALPASANAHLAIGLRSRGDPRGLFGAVHRGVGARRQSCPRPCRRSLRGSARLLRQAQAVDCRRTGWRYRSGN
jgi:hypothetical protein